MSNINNLANYQSRSRLHFIGSWVNEATGMIRTLLEQHPEHDHSALFGEQHIVCHIDMDCFFVLVALSKPENEHLRGRPVAVASGGKHSEVSSCSYKAREFGVRAGMWTAEAMRLCPDLTLVQYDFDRVRAINEQIYRAAFELCPPGAHMKLQVLSVDEFFVAFDSKDFDLAELYCNSLRERIERESNGCTASCGIAPNVHVARAVTSLAKPNGVHCVRNDEKLVSFVQKMRVDEIHGVGRVANDKIREMMEAERNQQHLQQMKAFFSSNSNALKNGNNSAAAAAAASNLAGSLLIGQNTTTTAAAATTMTTMSVAAAAGPQRRGREETNEENSNGGKAPAADGDLILLGDSDNESEVGLSGEEKHEKRSREREKQKQQEQEQAKPQQQAAAATTNNNSKEIKIGDLCAVPLERMRRYLGNAIADKLHGLAHRGVDHTLVIGTGTDAGGALPKAVGTSMNYAVRLTAHSELSALLLQICKDVAQKLERVGGAAMIVKLSFAVRHPDAPVNPPKHLGCGRCIERQLGTAKAQAPDVAWFSAEKLHDLVMPFALRCVTIAEPAQQQQQQQQQQISEAIYIGDIRGITLHASGIVHRVKKTGAGSKPAKGGGGSHDGLQQISLTASFRNAIAKKEKEQQQQRAKNINSNSKPAESYNIDDDEDDDVDVDANDDDDDVVVEDDARNNKAAAAAAASGKARLPNGKIVPNSHQAKKLKQQREAEKAAATIKTDADGAVIICSHSQTSQSQQQQQPPQHAAPSKKTALQQSSLKAFGFAVNKSASMLNKNSAVSASGVGGGSSAAIICLDDDDDDDVVQVMSASPVKKEVPAVAATKATTTNLGSKSLNNSSRGVLVDRDDDNDVVEDVKVLGTDAKDSNDATAMDTPLGGVARVCAAIRSGKVLDILLRCGGGSSELQRLAASIVLAEAVSPVALPLLQKGERFPDAVLEAARRVLGGSC